MYNRISINEPIGIDLVLLVYIIVKITAYKPYLRVCMCVVSNNFLRPNSKHESPFRIIKSMGKGNLTMVIIVSYSQLTMITMVKYWCAGFNVLEM